MICNSGVGLTPIHEGRELHLSAGGLYNGLVLLIDDETRSYWDHITGEAVHGPLKGAELPTWPLRYTTAGRADPTLPIARVPIRGFGERMFRMITRGPRAGSRGLIPPGFRGTMGEEDTRLPTLEQGLGVIVDGAARFYPTALLRGGPIEDDWSGRRLRTTLADDGVPEALWADDGSRPMQLFTRWYGFSFTYPGCAIASRG